MLILGIETTCDETAASVVKNGTEILSNVIFSQIPLHQTYGGVFPEIASRSHVDKIVPIIKQALKEAKVSLEDIDAIAVAKEPGLIGSLLIGITSAKTLALTLNKPLIEINHVEAHLYAAMMDKEKLIFPALGVVLSGGHTMLLKISDIGKYEKIGTTIDDAIGESFDKVASMLDLGYPGGPKIEKLAKETTVDKYNFKPGKIKNSPFDFSFSGLKTKVLYTVKGQSSKKNFPTLIKNEEKKYIARSFQNCAFNDVISKAVLAAQKYNLTAIYFGGGVSNNRTLRKMFADQKIDIPLFWPQKNLSLDNAAMIAGLAYHKANKNFKIDVNAAIF